MQTLLYCTQRAINRTVQVYDGTDLIPVNRGVRQDDMISPKLFTTALKNIFKTLDWEKAGININSKYLSNLQMTLTPRRQNSRPPKHAFSTKQCRKKERCTDQCE